MDNDHRTQTVEYASHVSNDGRVEAVADHLREVAEMAREFGEPIGLGEEAYIAGSIHDLGKYSREFQRRLLDNGPKVDHATAGAWEFMNRRGVVDRFITYAVLGHHSGLLNGGSMEDYRGDNQGPSVWKRLNTARAGKLPDYSAYTKEVSLPEYTVSKSPTGQAPDYFRDSFKTRMLASCLVDADYLCTERFMKGKDRDKLTEVSLDELKRRLDKKLAGFENPTSELNRVRCDILGACRAAAEGPQGVYSLTVPTGGGKTLSSLAFALDHCAAHGLSRVIYAIPYTSIIEQNVEVFRESLDGGDGDDVVLEHHSSVDYEDSHEHEEDVDDSSPQRLATENWDAPVVVTTNVQLFESLYANRTSRMRKLHNLANSVIVLDEVQMLPPERIAPCVRALVELVRNYGCTVLLCSATQPSLDDLFEKYGAKVTEIVSDPEELAEKLRRVTFVWDGPLDDEELVDRLVEEEQALCVVNSRRQAHVIHGMLVDRLGEEGVFHLSTLMHSIHRSKTLEEIRTRLAMGERCLVVSTSLIEAGVDVDFPTVYRALAGIDSVVQAGGRCNREGRYPAASSVVHVFMEDASYGKAREVEFRGQITQAIVNEEEPVDLGSSEVIRDYFNRIRYKYQNSMDKGNTLAMMALEQSERSDKGVIEFDKDRGAPFPFKFNDAAKAFQLIDSNTETVVIPDEDIIDDLDAIRDGIGGRDALRRVARSGVTVYPGDVTRLRDEGAVDKLLDGFWVLVDQALYDPAVGLKVDDAGGGCLFA